MNQLSFKNVVITMALALAINVGLGIWSLAGKEVSILGCIVAGAHFLTAGFVGVILVKFIKRYPIDRKRIILGDLLTQFQDIKDIQDSETP